MIYTKRFNPSEVSDEQLLDALKELSAILGRTPSASDMSNSNNSLCKKVHLYRQRFGRLQEAQTLAGLAFNKGGEDVRYSPEDLLQELKRLSGELKRVPTQQDLNDFGKYPCGAYKRHFGNYNSALERAKLPFNIKANQTTDDIKKDILDLSVKLGRAPTSREFSENTNTVCSLSAAHKICNNSSWNSALKACGLKVVYNKNVSEVELKAELLRLEKELGRVPGYHDMAQLGNYAPETYALRFGTYLKALAAFGFNYISQSQWENQEFTLAKDNYLYKSKFESNIADILLSLKFEGKITNYEYEKQVCLDRKWTCDFFIKMSNKDVWMEADGMGANRPISYSASHEKIRFYIDNNFNYVIIPYGKKLKQSVLSALQLNAI